ncbi:MAG: hypothetical protein RBS17_00020 [Coriobacteriia bacterium]|nr:hypothetical protein [Coriobacteriia bacterium]
MDLDTGFRPSRHGFGFTNSWRDQLFGVVPSRGRCGGMVFAALDSFLAGHHLPAEGCGTVLPPHSSPLARAIWKRQIDSVVVARGKNLWCFARFTYLPSTSVRGISVATRQGLLPLFDMMRGGLPVPLGLVSGIGLTRMARNHQVLAYGADFMEDRALVYIYDPNHPRRDDVTLEIPMNPRMGIVEHIGTRLKQWRGAFIERYQPARPIA